jgi:hypothetical protein
MVEFEDAIEESSPLESTDTNKPTISSISSGWLEVLVGAYCTGQCSSNYTLGCIRDVLHRLSYRIWF